jgi:hypothetical protein
MKSLQLLLTFLSCPVWALPAWSQLTYHAKGGFSEGLAFIEIQKVLAVIDTAGNILYRLDYEEAGQFSEGYAPVQIEGSWGYIDRAGLEVITPMYHWAAPFSEGQAVVAQEREDHIKYYYINKAGKAGGFRFDLADDFSEGLAAFMVTGQNGAEKFGYLSSKGTIAILPTYQYAESFNCGLAAVKRNGKWGYINNKGQVIIPFIYDAAGNFSEDKAAVAMIGAKDSSGKSMPLLWNFQTLGSPKPAEYLYEQTQPYSEQMAAVKMNGKWGFVNARGQVSIAAQYDAALPFKDGLAAVQKKGQWGFIDRNGRLVIPMIYDTAESFSNHYARVSSGGIRGTKGIIRHGRYFFINRKGQALVVKE